jgi:hypothetical protein
MVSSRTASRGQLTNSPSSRLSPLLKRQLLRRFDPHRTAEHHDSPTFRSRRLKSARHLVSIRSKNQADYVTRRFNASLAGLKKPVGLIFAGTPPNAISKFN